LIKRSVVTIAVGNAYYLKIAANLLQSFLLWNKENDVNFLLLTDNATFYDQYKNLTKVTIRQILLAESEKSFTSKFNLFEHAIADENLFIDCDCLIYKNLDFVFEEFGDKNFSAVGNNIASGEFFCNVKKTLSQFKIDSMPKFVGSIYYFKNNAQSQRVFENALQLKKKYDELGFVRLRDKENEEPLFAVAMQMAGEKLLLNTGNIKADLMYYKKVSSNILKGQAQVSDPITTITGGEAIPDNAMPAILHFNASFSEGNLYKSEAIRLKYSHLNIPMLNTCIFIFVNIPYVTVTTAKNYLRPLYHAIWGYRKIKTSNRISE
jgi:hypothetical protein